MCTEGERDQLPERPIKRKKKERPGTPQRQGRGVFAVTFKLVVVRLLECRPRAEVDDLDLQRPRVHDDVLVLDVAVDDAMGVEEAESLHNLPEEPEEGGEGEEFSDRSGGRTDARQNQKKWVET